MKSNMMAVLAVSGILIAGYAFANDGHDHSTDNGAMKDGMMHDQGMMEQGKEGESKAIEVGNKVCPVSGNPIPAPGEKGEMGEAVKYEYNGKIYNLCCSMCAKDFKKNPEKYSKIAEEEAAKDKAMQQEGQPVQK